MDIDRRIEELFQQAVTLAPAERSGFLREHCNEELRAQVESLLRHHDAAAAHESRGGVVPTLDLDRAEASLRQTPPFPQQVGRYRILTVLGHGGMGSVYKAEQDKPHRKVALKVIRPGLMTASMLRRFEYEADVLARLDHPGIARIFDAGTEDSGLGPQPYFAMELVHGKRLDEFIRETNPSTNQRLKLLIDICNAVHHAHTKGVIHRDLKPSNILVTNEGQPKILDFGVARAIDSDIQATTLHTESGQLIGTLPYMAPEQAAGKVSELDTSSDVYALGVIAYELLSGKMPYSLENKALHEAVRVICEQEPSRLSSINKSLRGDVETIVQKALEKDKSRRYHTAGEFAADVKRYLDYEPISARPPGTWYQLGKFTKRNKILVGGVVTAMILLLAGFTGTTIGLVGQARARAEAEQRRAESEAVNKFLSGDVLAGASPANLPDKHVRDVIVEKMIEPAAARVGIQFSSRPLVEASVREALALAFHTIGRSDEGLPHAQRAVEIRRRMLGDNHPDTIRSINVSAELYLAQGNLANAEALFREALERRRRVLGDDHPDTSESMNNLASVLHAQGKLAEAEPLYREALERSRRVLGDDHPDTLASINNMGYVLLSQGRYAEAEPLLREAVERFRQVLGDDHPDTLFSINSLGSLFLAQGKLAEAEPLFREALERSKRVLGSDHPHTLLSINNVGYLLKEQGRLAEAEPLFREALEQTRRLLGNDHPQTLAAINNMGLLLVAEGKLTDAERFFCEALETSRRKLGEDHPDTLTYMSNVGYVLRAQGKLAEAEPLYREALDRRRSVLGDDHLDTLDSISKMGALLEAQGTLVAAERLFAELFIRAQESQIPPQKAALYLSAYGPCLVKLGRHSEAAQPLRVAYDRLRKTGQEKHWQFKLVLESLLEVADVTNRPDEAAKWRAELAALEAATRPTTSATSPAG